MSLDPISFLKQVGAPYRMRSWGDPVEAQEIDIKRCIEVDKHLQAQSCISTERDIWDRVKIELHKRAVYKWKFWYGTLEFISVVLIATSLIAFSVSIKNGFTFGLLLSATLFLMSPVFWMWGNWVSHYAPSLSVEDCFSDQLTKEETVRLAKAIKDLENTPTHFFWVGKYLKLFEVPQHSLKDASWFLLLTGVEHDRKGIWLKGKYPRGRILIEKTREKPDAKNLDSIPPNSRWCPNLRAIQESITLIRKLVIEGDKQIRSNIIDQAFIPQINAYREIKDNGQNWKSYRKGILNLTAKEKLEAKLRTALYPNDPNCKKATDILNKFLKPDNRSFDEYVASLNIIPIKSVEKQISLYHESKKQPSSDQPKPAQTITAG